MKILNLFALFAFAAILAVGCAPAEESATSTPGVSDSSTATTTQQEMAKCGGCGNEVPKAELVAHDGKMMCKACMDAHQH